MADGRERSERAFGRPPELLVEFAARRRLGAFAVADQALGDRPGAGLLASPIGPAEMDEEDLGRRAAAAAMEEDAGASLGHALRRSRVG
jgi:hypothetical protein